MRHFEEKHGEKKKHGGTGVYEKALEILGDTYKEQTLWLLKSVAATFELLKRFKNLTWSHHLEVSSLKTVEIVPDKKLPQGRMQ